MPSSESSNALILPLAGHELGHCVWMSEQFETKYSSDTETSVRKYLKSNWNTLQSALPQYADLPFDEEQVATEEHLVALVSSTVELTLRRMEETFCDAMGVYLFGASYAHAFHYLLAPSLGGERALEYPALVTRAENIEKYGDVNLVNIGLANFGSRFQDLMPSLSKQHEFIVTTADNVAQNLAEQMFASAKAIVASRARTFIPDDKAVEQVLKMFRSNVPCNSPRALSDILSAGWAYVLEQESQKISEAERSLINWSSELIFKSLEVLEYRVRTAHA